MSAEEILFRPHACGDFMSGVAKGWDVEKSLTCKRKLIKMFREIKYGRYYQHTNKYTEKGIKGEEDAITLYSLVSKKLLRKNAERLTNEFFTGVPDIIGKGETIDVKCSWSLDTFPHPSTDKPDKDYEYQGQCYMDLCKASKHTIAYCLVNAPLNLVMKAKEALYYNMDCPDHTSKNFEEYTEGLIQIERNMIFDKAQFLRDNHNYDFECKEWIYDIPAEERVVEFVINRNEVEIEKIKSRLTECRAWMNTHLFKLQLETA